MQKRLLAQAVLSACLLSGCATTSFAPPVVNLSRQLKVESSNSNSCDAQIVAKGSEIKPDVDGARALIDNFIYVYRCRAHATANGRQAFELPQLILAAGGAIAAAYGASANVAIGTGGAGAILANGRNYYDPRQKAVIYDHALDALLCVKNEAVGIAAYDTGSRNLTTTTGTGGDTVQVPAPYRYYDMVTTALFQIERILSIRLSSTGTFDAAGIVAEIEAAQKKVEEAETASKPKSTQDEVKTTADPDSSKESTSEENFGANDIDLKPNVNSSTSDPILEASIKAAVESISNKSSIKSDTANRIDQDFRINLSILQPKLQKCVIRAKL